MRLCSQPVYFFLCAKFSAQKTVKCEIYNNLFPTLWHLPLYFYQYQWNILNVFGKKYGVIFAISNKTKNQSHEIYNSILYKKNCPSIFNLQQLSAIKLGIKNYTNIKIFRIIEFGRMQFVKKIHRYVSRSKIYYRRWAATWKIRIRCLFLNNGGKNHHRWKPRR